MHWRCSIVPPPLRAEQPVRPIAGAGRFSAAGGTDRAAPGLSGWESLGSPGSRDAEVVSDPELVARAEVFRVLASGERLELLNLIPPGGPTAAGESDRGPAGRTDLEWLRHALQLPVAEVERHVGLLLSAGFIAALRSATGKVHYVRDDDHLSALSARLGEPAA